MDLRRVFHVGQFKDEIKAQLRRDVEFLHSFRLMDYSMMVGVSVLAPCGAAVCTCAVRCRCMHCCVRRCVHHITPLTVLHAVGFAPMPPLDIRHRCIASRLDIFFQPVMHSVAIGAREDRVRACAVR
jgi:hypothetical protein